MIFFSAHGVPLAYVEEAGDPYKAEMEECVDLIMEELEKRKMYNSFTLAYQVEILTDSFVCLHWQPSFPGLFVYLFIMLLVWDVGGY